MSERAHWEKVLADNPNDAEALWRLGDVCYRAGETAQALAYKERALDLNPNLVGAEVHRQLGLSRWQQGHKERAAVDFQRAIAQGDEASRFLLGQLWAELGEWAAALSCFREVLATDPESLPALLNAGALHLRLEQPTEAIALYSQAVAAYPNSAEAQGRLGNAILVQGDWEEARLHLELALANDPTYVPAYVDLAAAWGRGGQPETAIAYARAALTYDSQNAAAYDHLGNAYLELNELAAAQACLETALALDPELPEVGGHLAIALLKQGKYTEGWPHYERRWRSPQMVWPAWATPVWQGEPVSHLLVWAEQGYGDTLQFARFVPLLRDRAQTVTLLAPAPLHPVLQGLGVPLVTAPVSCDATLPLLSVPGLLGISLGNLPQPPYLHTTPVALPRNGQRRLGLVWASKVDHPTAPQRSIPLSLLAPLLTLPNVQWVCLQKEVTPTERLQLASWQVLQPELPDFGATAAWIAALDLVITVDTAVAHLAGALGQPVWILLPWAADWRWLLDREDSPWYPSARLFRQPNPGAWEPVIAQVQTALSQGLAPISTPEPIAIGWQAGQHSGWEVFGANAALHLPAAHLLIPPQADDRLLAFYGERWARLRQGAEDFQRFAQGDRPLWVEGTVLHPLGNHPTAAVLERLRGRKNVAFLFAEDSEFTAAEVQALRAFDGVVVGSHWNAEILRAVGIAAPVVWQGIDPTLFHPGPKLRRWGDRFVVFSGGKLEYRKGQDLVLAAFVAFWQRHPDALLVTAWHTRWPQFIAGMNRYTSLPPLVHGTPAIVPWAIANGLPPDAIVDVGTQPHERLAPILREADVALFPNRAEGGTNLVAMECLACGVPTILSRNTGHLDLIDPARCYVLQQQGPVPPVPPIRSTEGWGESDIAEILETLETVYRDRTTAQAKGQAAAAWIAQYSWPRQMQRLAAVLSEISPRHPDPGDRAIYRFR